MRRRIGTVFQEFRLLDHLSAFDNAALPLRLAGVKPLAYAPDVEEMLGWDEVGGLAEVMDMLGVLGGDERMVGVVEAGLASGKLVCGHAAGLSGAEIASSGPLSLLPAPGNIVTPGFRGRYYYPGFDGLLHELSLAAPSE